MKTVRDNKLVWPYCEECGCRLEIRKDHFSFNGGFILLHFFGYTDKTDARGCTCSKADIYHPVNRSEIQAFL
jgi:hypothetical protein